MYRSSKASAAGSGGYQSSASDYWGKAQHSEKGSNLRQRKPVQKVGEIQNVWKKWGIVFISIGLLFGVV